KSGARGCFLIGTAATEAVRSPEVRALLRDHLRELDDVFEARIRKACADGELASDADTAALAKIASATLYSLALRSRAGDPRPVLESIAEAVVAAICASENRRRSRATPR